MNEQLTNPSKNHPGFGLCLTYPAVSRADHFNL